MSENIENTVQKEDMPATQEAQTSQQIQETQGDTASAAGGNVVPYPVSDKQTQMEDESGTNPVNPVNAATEVTASVAESVNTAAQHRDTETEAISESIQAPENAQNNPQNNTPNDPQNNPQNNPPGNEVPNSADSKNSRTSHYEEADDDEDLEEDFYEQQENSRSKDEHPFREFFSNFRSKRKIEMNRDEQILSRISDDDLMEYLRMEQKRMELLQQAKEVREKRFWTTFQLFICLLSVVLIIYFLKDNPVILVTILYTLGILTALRIWSKSQNRRDRKDGNDSYGHQKKPWE